MLQPSEVLVPDKSGPWWAEVKGIPTLVEADVDGTDVRAILFRDKPGRVIHMAARDDVRWIAPVLPPKVGQAAQALALRFDAFERAMAARDFETAGYVWTAIGENLAAWRAAQEGRA